MLRRNALSIFRKPDLMGIIRLNAIIRVVKEGRQTDRKELITAIQLHFKHGIFEIEICLISIHLFSDRKAKQKIRRRKIPKYHVPKYEVVALRAWWICILEL